MGKSFAGGLLPTATTCDADGLLQSTVRHGQFGSRFETRTEHLKYRFADICSERPHIDGMRVTRTRALF